MYAAGHMRHAHGNRARTGIQPHAVVWQVLRQRVHQELQASPLRSAFGCCVFQWGLGAWSSLQCAGQACSAQHWLAAAAAHLVFVHISRVLLCWRVEALSQAESCNSESCPRKYGGRIEQRLARVAGPTLLSASIHHLQLHHAEQISQHHTHGNAAASPEVERLG